MQIVETANEGLERSYTVTIPATDIASKIDGEVARLAPQVRMPGFRPGKVPTNLVRKMHGAQLRQEALNTSIRDAVNQLVADRQLRPAMAPKIDFDQAGAAAGNDVELSVRLEVLPQIAAPVLDGLALERLVVPVTDAEVDEAVARLAGQQKRFDPADEGHAAESGDQLLADFVGRLGDTPFEGGSAQNQAIELGAGRLIPGFEEQLIGARAGERRTIAVTFPADYGAKPLAGKDATFDVTVHEVRVPGATQLDDALATQLGLESLDQLTGLMRGQLEQQSAGLTRTAMKRALLDQLAAAHDFAVPPSMVEAEFGQIVAQLEQEAGKEPDPDAARAEIEAESGDYRAIAERRVRLGLLLSEIGQANGVMVTPQEMQALVAQAAQQYRPADRDRFAEYIRDDAMAAAQLRAPLYEDKVVDFLIGKAEVTEREVTRDELQAAIEADEPHVHGPNCQHDDEHEHEHDHGHAHHGAAEAAAQTAADVGDAAQAPEPAGPDLEAAAAPPAAPPADAKPARKPVARRTKADAPASVEDDAEAAQLTKKPARRATKKVAAAE